MRCTDDPPSRLLRTRLRDRKEEPHRFRAPHVAGPRSASRIAHRGGAHLSTKRALTRTLTPLAIFAFVVSACS
ncbi:MAG TPA: hypothetical protein VFO78_01370, partial [Candidatus Limnocylindrales bacterium]|nr:hypothetical protein [Candidatus Limnocylindrales bacterium]